MTGQSFSLQPFPSSSPLFSVKITGSIRRHGQSLAIGYALRGPLAELVIPAPAEMRARRHGLWEETCFEFFLGARNSPGYWEFNLSPAGHWNVYRFAGYRQGMKEEFAFSSLPFHIRRQAAALLLDVELDFHKIEVADQALEVAIAAVVKFAGGEVTYWALTHPGPQADFHRRDGFGITL